jgi:predicted Fe-S protein YdhL (DUF1289 family)
MLAELTPKTPCVGRCSTSLGDDICKGCYRTYKEVIDWNGCTDEQKSQILLNVKKRKDVLHQSV